MKQFIVKVKKRKLLSSMFLISFVGIICGLLFISILSNENKEIITSSVNGMFDTIFNNKFVYKDILIKSLLSNLILNIIIWLLGISIIGIFLLYCILFFKCFMVSFTFMSILYTFKFSGIFFSFVYVIPYILNFFIYFILIYYALSFSKTLFNFLFRNKECNKREFIKRYIILLIISCLLLVLSSLIETFFIPFLLNLIKL